MSAHSTVMMVALNISYVHANVHLNLCQDRSWPVRYGDIEDTGKLAPRAMHLVRNRESKAPLALLTHEAVSNMIYRQVEIRRFEQILNEETFVVGANR